MILVTGAGGKTGRTLVKALSEAESIYAIVHHEEHVLVLESLGAEKVIVGDLRVESAIRSAVQGVRAVYHVCPNMSPDEIMSENPNVLRWILNREPTSLKTFMEKAKKKFNVVH